MPKRDLDAEIAALEAQSGPELRAYWTSLTGTPVPRVKPRLLRLALAWELQARAHGGLSRRCQQRLAQLAAAKSRTTPVRPGMRLVREWQGVLHQVSIDEEGMVLWNGARWKSLSEVARAITGTRWSGPAFFGLKTMASARASGGEAKPKSRPALSADAGPDGAHLSSGVLARARAREAA